MNQKKCPKCGENNPAEAVMCWACYTPLSGAPVASGPIPGSTPAPGEAPEKKPIAPWQIGVIGLALLIAAGFGISTMMGGSTADMGMDTPIPNVQPPMNTNVPVASGGTVNVEAPGLQQSIAQTPQQQLDRGAVSAYTVTTQPNRKWPIATVGIVPTQPNIAPAQAAKLAATLGRRMKGSWKNTHIYVFSDAQAADAFQQYQRGRDNAPLEPNDYSQLQNVWRSTLARYEISNGVESIRYPQQNANWWAGARRRG